jgi:tRNA-dihydrouridine synthase 2
VCTFVGGVVVHILHGVVPQMTEREELLPSSLNDNHTEKPTCQRQGNAAHGRMSVDEKASALYRGEGLAPMVRASTIPLRTLALKYGADFCYTEELIDRSLSSTVRVVNKQLGTIDYVKMDPHGHVKNGIKRKLSHGNYASLLILRLDPKIESNKLICQIGSGDPELALAAAVHVHQDVDAIDINMGCPKKFSVGGGMGSALLSDPDRACRIIRTLSNTLSSSNNMQHAPIPVSAKIRLLHDTKSTLDFVTSLINAGANAIAIHGRHVSDPDVQSAYWDELSEVVSLATQKFPHVPILINGDFYTRHEFTNFIQCTGAAGVLLARPALYNTGIFRKPSPDTTEIDTFPIDSNTPLTKSALYGYNSPLLLDKTTVVQDYLRESIRYDGHYKNVKYVICEMMNSRRAPHARVPYLQQEFLHGQTIGTTCAQCSLEGLCQLWNVNFQMEHQRYTPQQELLPGEHKYLDSYLLQQQPPNEVTKGTSEASNVSTDVNTLCTKMLNKAAANVIN